MDHRHRIASIYLRNGVFVVVSESYLGDGGGGSVANGWVKTSSAKIDDELLGQMVRAAWAVSESNVPMPDFSRPFPAWQKVLTAVGVRTERQFAKGNVLVNVELKCDFVELLPTRNDGTGGFDHLPELMMVATDAAVDDVILGHRVREAIGRSC